MLMARGRNYVAEANFCPMLLNLVPRNRSTKSLANGSKHVLAKFSTRSLKETLRHDRKKKYFLLLFLIKYQI